MKLSGDIANDKIFQIKWKKKYMSSANILSQ